MDETTIKNIVTEIIRECTHKEIEVSESFISYYVRLLIMDPAWEIMSEQFFLERNALQKFIKYIITMLRHDKCPCMMTLRIQKYFMCNFDKEERKSAIHHRITLREKLAPLENEIVNADNDSSEELEKLYKKIVYYITLLSGLGNPSVPTVYKEAHTALSSIFNSADCAEFAYCIIEDKVRHLMEYTELCAGIRLFNRDCKKGGKGIEDIPKIMINCSEITRKELQDTLREVMDYINFLTTAIDVCFRVEKKTVGYYLVCEVPPDVDVEDLTYAKNMLVFYRQYEIYLRQFLDELDHIESIFSELNKEYSATLQKLHEICQFRTAIPVNLVFPHFKDLSNIWCRMQDEIIQLANMNQILINIQNRTKDLEHRKDVLHIMLGKNEIVTDAQRLEITPELSMQMMRNRKYLLDPNTIKNFQKIPLQYLGFCAWKFVEMHGALIPGNPNMGVARIKNKYYVFSCLEAAEEFCRNYDKYVHEGVLILRHKPELINLLGMYDAVNSFKNIKGIQYESRDLLITRNICVQTETHVTDHEANSNYKWNVWDLKQQALMMANVSKCVTKSVQTDKAGSKNAVRLQTYDNKDQCMQTKTDGYSNVPTLSNYIYGLRGRKDDKQFIIELTRPVNE